MEKQAILQSLAEVTNAIAKVAEAIANSNTTSKPDEETLKSAFRAGYDAAVDRFSGMTGDHDYKYFNVDGEVGGDSFSVDINLDDHLYGMVNSLSAMSSDLNDDFYEWNLDNARKNGEQA
jgi:hypothetical protein